MFNLLLKSLRERRTFILGWAGGLAFLGFLMMSFYTSFNGGEIDSLMKSLPPALQGFVGNLQDWRQLPGYIGSQIFDIRFPIFVSILSILLAVGLTVSEEEKGQLRTIVALPISRTKIIFAKWLALAVICAIAAIATIFGIELGLLVINQSIDQMVLVRLGLFTWLMVTSLSTIIFSLGLATGKRAITTGVGIILTIGSFLLSTFASAVSWLADYEKFSFLYYFPAVDVAKGVINWANVILYGGIIVVSLAVAWLCFRNRDIQAS